MATAALPVAALVAALGCRGEGAGIAGSQADLSTGQALLEVAEALGQLREENAVLQGQVDSLRLVVARQDTLLRQLAAQAGVAVPP